MQFPSKILLFGEYGLVLGGSGLAIPYPEFSGQLVIDEPILFNKSTQSAQSYQSIKKLYNFLAARLQQNTFLDLYRYSHDLDRGIWFDSNIPNGYGLGSSGALVASIYNEYVIDTGVDLLLVKKRLASIEGYFHGSSSGVDPLVSYIQQPIILNSNGKVEVFKNWNISQLGVKIYLVDTGAKSNTKHLVDWFNTKMMQADFSVRSEKDYLLINEKIIHGIQNRNKLDLYDLLTISRYQLEYLNPMIPNMFYVHFLAGLNSGDFAFKLCGSGGGGFMLCFAYDDKKTISYFDKKKIAFRRIG